MLAHRSSSTADYSRLRVETGTTITPEKSQWFSQASFTGHCWRQDQDGLFASCSVAFLLFLSSERIHRDPDM